MDKPLKKLEIERLIKELEFLESDYIYQSNVISTKEYEFMNSIDNVVQGHPDLKKISDSRINKLMTKSVDLEESEEELKSSDFKGKKLYREIVKLTHPDMVKNSILNELYLKATASYENEDIVGLYKISLNLGIELELGDNEIQEIMEKIKATKNKIEGLKSSWTYKWILSSDKNKIIVEYIKNNYLNLIS